MKVIFKEVDQSRENSIVINNPDKLSLTSHSYYSHSPGSAKKLNFEFKICVPIEEIKQEIAAINNPGRDNFLQRKLGRPEYWKRFQSTDSNPFSGAIDSDKYRHMLGALIDEPFEVRQKNFNNHNESIAMFFNMKYRTTGVNGFVSRWGNSLSASSKEIASRATSLRTYIPREIDQLTIDSQNSLSSYNDKVHISFVMDQISQHALFRKLDAIENDIFFFKNNNIDVNIYIYRKNSIPVSIIYDFSEVHDFLRYLGHVDQNNQAKDVSEYISWDLDPNSQSLILFNTTKHTREEIEAMHISTPGSYRSYTIREQIYLIQKHYNECKFFIEKSRRHGRKLSGFYGNTIKEQAKNLMIERKLVDVKTLFPAGLAICGPFMQDEVVFIYEELENTYKKSILNLLGDIEEF
jgi:hypothetical protein